PRIAWWPPGVSVDQCSALAHGARRWSDLPAPQDESRMLQRIAGTTPRPGKEHAMSFKGKHALVTGGSRGIGRGIALKLAESGARVAVHYYANEGAAKDTLERVRKHGADGFLVQADVSRVDDVRRMFGEVKQRFGTLDVFVANARPEAAKFYQKPMEITLEAWDHAMDSQAKAFLVGVREAAGLGNAVAMLCSAEASWITGQLIYADGGASLVDTLLPLEIQRG